VVLWGLAVGDIFFGYVNSAHRELDSVAGASAWGKTSQDVFPGKPAFARSLIRKDLNQAEVGRGEGRTVCIAPL